MPRLGPTGLASRLIPLFAAASLGIGAAACGEERQPVVNDAERLGAIELLAATPGVREALADIDLAGVPPRRLGELLGRRLRRAVEDLGRLDPAGLRAPYRRRIERLGLLSAAQFKRTHGGTGAQLAARLGRLSAELELGLERLVSDADSAAAAAAARAAGIEIALAAGRPLERLAPAGAGGRHPVLGVIPDELRDEQHDSLGYEILASDLIELHDEGALVGAATLIAREFPGVSPAAAFSGQVVDELRALIPASDGGDYLTSFEGGYRRVLP